MVEEYLLIYKTESIVKKKLLEEEHIEKFNNCSDHYFISPIVITVKRDQTIKLALDSNILDGSINE